MALCLVRNTVLRNRFLHHSFTELMCLHQKRLLSLSSCYCLHLQSSDSSQHKSKKPDSEQSGTELDVARENPYAGLTMGQKVKEAGKDISYIGISLAALGMLGAIIYIVGRELFSSESPNGVYSKALKRCSKDSEVIVALGQPIKGYGEETRRGRRRHDESGVYNYRYLFVQLDQFPYNTIVLEDNR